MLGRWVWLVVRAWAISRVWTSTSKAWHHKQMKFAGSPGPPPAACPASSPGPDIGPFSADGPCHEDDHATIVMRLPCQQREADRDQPWTQGVTELPILHGIISSS